MKRIISLVLCVLMTLAFAVTAFAAEPSLSLNESYDPASGTVDVRVTVNDAEGLGAGLIKLVFDDTMCSYIEESFTQLAPVSVTAVGGKVLENTNECSCAFLMLTALDASECDSEGNMPLAEYKFKVSGTYTAGRFYVYAAEPFEYNGENVEVQAGGSKDFAPAVNTTASQEANPNAPADTVTEESSTADSDASEEEKSSPALWIIIPVVAVIGGAAAAAVVLMNKKKKEQSR